MTKREEAVAEITRLKEARRRSNSQHLKNDYGKAIRRKQNELRAYDRYRRQASRETAERRGEQAWQID